ncbi:MAG: hypothetical protein WDW38_004037 [Sanguina aurantia]
MQCLASDDPRLVASALQVMGLINRSLQSCPGAADPTGRTQAGITDLTGTLQDDADEGGCEGPRTITSGDRRATWDAVHGRLLEFCGHHHPSARRAAVAGLSEAGFSDLSQQQATATHAAAAAALADSHHGVREAGVALLQRLALQLPPGACGDGLRQFGTVLSLQEDVFQRLCACVCDPCLGVKLRALEALSGESGLGVKPRALEALSGESGLGVKPRALEALSGGSGLGVKPRAIVAPSGLHTASMRVQLQAMNKKATMRVSVAALRQEQQRSAAETATAPLPTTVQARQAAGRKGAQPGSAVATGATAAEAGGSTAQPTPVASSRLLDDATGAFVYGVEDEIAEVRQATLAAVCALACWEQRRGPGAASNSGGGEPSQPPGGMTAPCLEMLVDSLQDDALDEALSRRLAQQQQQQRQAGQGARDLVRSSSRSATQKQPSSRNSSQPASLRSHPPTDPSPLTDTDLRAPTPQARSSPSRLNPLSAASTPPATTATLTTSASASAAAIAEAAPSAHPSRAPSPTSVGAMAAAAVAAVAAGSASGRASPSALPLAPHTGSLPPEMAAWSAIASDQFLPLWSTLDVATAWGLTQQQQQMQQMQQMQQKQASFLGEDDQSPYHPPGIAVAAVAESAWSAAERRLQLAMASYSHGKPQGPALTAPAHKPGWGKTRFMKLLGDAREIRGEEASAFKREMRSIDDEIQAYVSNFKFDLNALEAAATVQAALRARGPRLFFNRFQNMRRRHLLRRVQTCFSPMLLLVRAQHQQGRWLRRRCFEEWKLLGDLATELFSKALAKLRASIGSVKDRGSPSMLWTTCVGEGADPWVAHLTLGTLVSNTLKRQQPRRAMQVCAVEAPARPGSSQPCFSAVPALVAGGHATQLTRMQDAARKLQEMEARRFRGYVHLLFRFWFRYSIIKISERLSIPPPLFRPRVPLWDSGCGSTTAQRSCRAGSSSCTGFRLRHCFDFWLFFARRNARMRTAWVATASVHIKEMLRCGLNAFKANWKQRRCEARLRRSTFDSWLHQARRNIKVRQTQHRVTQVRDGAALRQAFRQVREWGRMSALLSASASIQIWQRRSLALGHMYAWTGDATHMWFSLVFHRWRAHTVGRMRMRCLLEVHLRRQPRQHLELAFKGWRKVVELGRPEPRAFSHQPPCHPNDPTMNHAPWPTADSRLEGARSGLTSAAMSRSSSMHKAAAVTGLTRAGLKARAGGAVDGRRACWLRSRCTAAAAALSDSPCSEHWVHVCMGDYPMRSPLKPRLSLAELMLANEGHAQQRGITGRGRSGGWGGTCSSCRSGDTGLEQRLERRLQPLQLWRSSPPEPYLWQRVVGMLATGQGHPESITPLLDRASLPHSGAVLAIKNRMLRSRMGPSSSRSSTVTATVMTGDGDGDGDGFTPPADTCAMMGSAMTKAPRRSVGGVPEVDTGQPTHSRLVEVDRWGVDPRVLASGLDPEGECIDGIRPHLHLNEWQRDVVFVNKLGEAEAVLEASAIVVLGLGSKDMHLFHELLNDICPKELVLLGDRLLWLLAPALRSDVTFMQSNLVYRTNRDRVITGALGLVQAARALNLQRPEFTLTYPNDNPTDRWKQMVDQGSPTDEEEEDDADRKGRTALRHEAEGDESPGEAPATADNDADSGSGSEDEEAQDEGDGSGSHIDRHPPLHQKEQKGQEGRSHIHRHQARGGGTASHSRTGSAHASSTNLPTLDEGSLHLDDNEEACVDQMVLQLPDFMTAADADAIQVNHAASISLPPPSGLALLTAAQRMLGTTFPTLPPMPEMPPVVYSTMGEHRSPSSSSAPSGAGSAAAAPAQEGPVTHSVPSRTSSWQERIQPGTFHEAGGAEAGGPHSSRRGPLQHTQSAMSGIISSSSSRLDGGDGVPGYGDAIYKGQYAESDGGEHEVLTEVGGPPRRPPAFPAL